MKWHAENLEEAYTQQDSSKEGLSQKEADKRLDKHGTNTIESGEDVSPVQIFISQFQDFPI